MIRALTRAAAEAVAHLCNAIIEAIDARRPLHDEPLIDDPARAEIAEYLSRHRAEIRDLAAQTDTPTLIWPEPIDYR